MFQLHEEGIIHELNKKWMKVQSKDTCKHAGLKPMGLMNVKVLLIVLGCGLILSFLVSVHETLWNKQRYTNLFTSSTSMSESNIT